MNADTATFLYGLLMAGMGALITGLFWANAYRTLQTRCHDYMRERDFYITRAVASQKAHAEAVDDLRRHGIPARLRSVK
jgi:hypothetical protein